MKIISFAWTTPPLLAGAKTMTWRDWPDAYARTFRPQEICQAWNKLPRAHGQWVVYVRLLSIAKATTADMTDDDYKAEGLAWMAEHPEAWPKTIWGRRTTAWLFTREFFDSRREAAEPGYIVRFDWLGQVRTPEQAVRRTRRAQLRVVPDRAPPQRTVIYGG